MATKYTKSFRSVYLLTAHIVFVCKYRKKLLANSRLTNVEIWLKETCEKWECEVIEVNGESDHVHLLISYPPKVCLSKLIANLKTVSSRLYRKQYKLSHSLWTGSYFVASCGGVTVDDLKRYVQNQDRPK